MMTSLLGTPKVSSERLAAVTEAESGIMDKSLLQPKKAKSKVSTTSAAVAKKSTQAQSGISQVGETQY